MKKPNCMIDSGPQHKVYEPTTIPNLQLCLIQTLMRRLLLFLDDDEAAQALRGSGADRDADRLERTLLVRIDDGEPPLQRQHAVEETAHDPVSSSSASSGARKVRVRCGRLRCDVGPAGASVRPVGRRESP